MPLRPEHAELVLSWRNRPDVRENMYTTHEITPPEHAAWIAGLDGDSKRRYFVFHVEGMPVGVVGFTEIAGVRGTASWAFYSGNPQVKGLGSLMERCALLYAFERLGLRQLSCEVLSHNLRVVEMHRRFGFRLEGIRRAQHLRPDTTLDIYLLALSRSDWERGIHRAFPSSLYRATWADEAISISAEVTDAVPAALALRGLRALTPGAYRHVASRDDVRESVERGARLSMTTRALTGLADFYVLESVVRRDERIVAVLERDFVRTTDQA